MDGLALFVSILFNFTNRGDPLICVVCYSVPSEEEDEDDDSLEEDENYMEDE